MSFRRRIEHFDLQKTPKGGQLPLNKFGVAIISRNKPGGDRDHEVLGMGSFVEYAQLYGN
jgi:hypothetical protein